MALQNPSVPRGAPKHGQKRKEHPSHPSSESNKRARTDHRAKQRDARTIYSQTSSKALKNGELDVDKFVKAREYEIRALEDGMSRSKKALNTRAFQQVPKELRRRTASHNAKRVPKRLQSRAKREMVEDNTPTVTAKKRKPTRHMRLRIETAKRLRSFGAKSKAQKQEATEEVSVRPITAHSGPKDTPIWSRKSKIKRTSLAAPPVVKAKFRRRQINKTWLPTHMFHAKRARMTPPRDPLWKFAVPLTPTAKSYRPTHRAANEKGAVAWDVSYISTIRLEGQQRSLESTLKALGVGLHGDGSMWERQGERWRNGTRIWQGLLSERENPHQPMAPATVIWCVSQKPEGIRQNDDPQKHRRALLIRVHPSAFPQVWSELLCLSKIAKPQISVEDLRFEIGSIEITGPGAIEALQGTLYPSPLPDGTQHPITSVEGSWKLLAGLDNQAVLPPDVLLGFDVQDSRLHHPPRTVNVSAGVDDHDQLLEFLAAWPLDTQQGAAALFERRARLAASSALPSQKAINRRKALATPGQYPEPLSKDPRIPILLYCQTNRKTREATWMVLLPWKCVQPLWYSIMYYPLSTGGQPRFGGLDELRQLAFEKGRPWFPGDYPGTQAGWAWEMKERTRLQDGWLRQPKSKRINWDSVTLASGRKGEIGAGWACDWERLLHGPPEESQATVTGIAGKTTAAENEPNGQVENRSLDGSKQASTYKPPSLIHISAAEGHAMIAHSAIPTTVPGMLVTVRLKLLVRGVPQACARIYRIPSAASGNLRNRWLDLHPQNQARGKPKEPKHGLPSLPKGAPAHIVRQRLARSLLETPRPGETGYPPCPPEDDLVGFVTSGNYNLGEGQGSGVGSILLKKVIEDIRRDATSGYLCVVRNAGNNVGRLAKWEIV